MERGQRMWMVWSQSQDQVFGFNFFVYILYCPLWLIPSPLRIWGASHQGGAVPLRETILQYSKKQASKQTAKNCTGMGGFCNHGWWLSNPMPSLGSLQGFQMRLIFQRGKQDRFVTHFTAFDKRYCESKRFINRITKRPTVCSFCIIFYIIISVSPKLFPRSQMFLNCGFFFF